MLNEQFEVSGFAEGKHERKTTEDSGYEEDMFEWDAAPLRSSKTVEKRNSKRKITPVPKDPPLLTDSELHSLRRFGGNFLFLQEEDDDDVNMYNFDDDFVADMPHVKSDTFSENRRSWHGTELLDSGDYIFGEKLRKTRSAEELRERRKGISMDTQTDLLQRHHPVADYSRVNGEDLSMEGIRIEMADTEERLPQWMQEAEETDKEINQRMSSPPCKCSLGLPEVDWNKLNQEKNKTYEKLKDQRKNTQSKNLQKQKMEKRRRKITPSDSPSSSSLEKLHQIKNDSDKWRVMEEEEEEE